MRHLSGTAERLASATSGGRVTAARPRPRRIPRVSVVIPCFNYGRYLPACVASVVNQPGVDVDVLIVDDASTDDSGNVADDLAAAHPAVRVLHHARNAGHLQTYNDGLAAVDGDYVVLLSADDLLTPGSLARATALLEDHPAVGLVYGHTVPFSDPEPPPARTTPAAWVLWDGLDWLTERFRQGRNCVTSPEVVVRMSVHRQVGYYRSDLPHTADMELWLRVAAVSDVGYVSGADQAWYRQHPSNMHTTMFSAAALAGMADEMRERLRALTIAADDLPVENADHLRALAQRALAVEALTLAIRAFYWGHGDAWPIDELMAFAAEAYPDAARLPHWKALRLHRRLGTGWPQLNPLSVSHRLSLKAQDAVRDWRLIRAGV